MTVEQARHALVATVSGYTGLMAAAGADALPQVIGLIDALIAAVRADAHREAASGQYLVSKELAFKRAEEADRRGFDRVRFGWGEITPIAEAWRSPEQEQIERLKDKLEIATLGMTANAERIRDLEAERDTLRQQLADITKERNDLRTLAGIGTWHDDCRLNRQMAARELEKSQAVINKLADEIADLRAQLAQLTERAERAEGRLREAFEAGWQAHTERVNDLIPVLIPEVARDACFAAFLAQQESQS